MPLDPRARRFLERLAGVNPPGILTLTVSERREGLKQLLSFSGPAEAVADVENRTLPGPDRPVNVRIYTPAAAGPGPLPGLIFFHGGGLVAGSLDTHDAICRSLSNSSGCRVIAVEYRLAPEHPFPAAIADGYAVTVAVVACAHELGLDERRIGIGGDSAGATLAAVLCQRVVAAGEVGLAFQFLLCPIMDFRTTTQSRLDFARGYLVDQETLEHDLKHYLGPDTDPADPRVSPLRACEVAALPPTCIHTAEFDPLRDEGAAYAERLRESGVKTTYRCHAGMIHLFYGLGALIPYAPTAYELIGADIVSMLA